MKKITPLINCLQKIYCVQTEMDHVPTGFQLLLKSARKLSPNSQLVIRIIKKLPNREFQQFQPGAYQESLWYACVCALSFIHVLPSGLVWIVCDPMDCRQQTPLSTGLSGRNTVVGCHALLQGIFLTQGSNSHLYVSGIGRQVLYH